MAWLYLFLASLFEIAWTFSLRFLSIKKFKAIQWGSLFSQSANWKALAPFIGYALFGLGNVYFISQAMKDIPASTALAVWMGTALVGVKLIEIIFLKTPYDLWQFLYIGLILIGIVGLKRMP
ncbi:MAG TPA: SMR family transporter [Puia sp.]|nr:SMR family transporter [Puia sp.]